MRSSHDNQKQIYQPLFGMTTPIRWRRPRQVTWQLMLMGFCIGGSVFALMAIPWSSSREVTLQTPSSNTKPFSDVRTSRSYEMDNTNNDDNLPQPRTCSSPEYDTVEWPLGGCTNNHQNNSTIQKDSVSQVTGESCGLCQQSPFALHLQELADHIGSRKREECQELVVFGAAFGQKYFDWIWKKRWSAAPPQNLSCHFMFVLDETLRMLPTKRQRRSHSNKTTESIFPTVGLLPDSTLTRTGGQHVVGVRRKDLSYANHRRNIKLFKLNPHLLFPWAKRIIWVDAKMKLSPQVRSSSLKSYFEHSVQKRGVCGSLVSLPLHPATMGDASVSISTVRFSCQCDAIREAFEFRPHVSDSPHSVRQQCEYYLQQINGSNGKFGRDLKSVVSPVLDTTMIDSAVLAWDLRHARCRKFVSNLMCTWLNEIHCFSDRDQLSFGYALDRMNVRLENGTFPEYSHRLYTHEHDDGIRRPVLNFIKSRCHWYYGKSALFKCDYYEADPAIASQSNSQDPIKLLPTKEMV